MITRLEIYELVTENDFARVELYPSVRVQYENQRGSAHDETGQVIAQITSYSDDGAVEIGDDYIKIAGNLFPSRGRDRYGYWLLRLNQFNPPVR